MQGPQTRPGAGAGPGKVLPTVLVQEGEEVQQALPIELGDVHGTQRPHRVWLEPRDLTYLQLLLPSSGLVDIYG